MNINSDEVYDKFLSKLYFIMWKVPSIDVCNRSIEFYMNLLNNLLDKKENNFELKELNNLGKEIMRRLEDLHRFELLSFLIKPSSKKVEMFSIEEKSLVKSSQIHTTIQNKITDKSLNSSWAEASSKFYNNFVSPIKDIISDNISFQKNSFQNSLDTHNYNMSSPKKSIKAINTPEKTKKNNSNTNKDLLDSISTKNKDEDISQCSEDLKFLKSDIEPQNDIFSSPKDFNDIEDDKV
ncbi:MAG: hypothetical protein MHPSP_001901, partial [Paramarteilia canceri]